MLVHVFEVRFLVTYTTTSGAGANYTHILIYGTYNPNSGSTLRDQSNYNKLWKAFSQKLQKVFEKIDQLIYHWNWLLQLWFLSPGE